MRETVLQVMSQTEGAAEGDPLTQAADCECSQTGFPKFRDLGRTLGSHHCPSILTFRANGVKEPMLPCFPGLIGLSTSDSGVGPRQRWRRGTRSRCSTGAARA